MEGDAGEGDAGEGDAGAGPRALFAVYLGGDPAPGRLGEDHEVVLVAASGIKEARAAAKRKWSGPSRPHVDGVMRVESVDGYAIRLERTGAPDSAQLDTTYEEPDAV